MERDDHSKKGSPRSRCARAAGYATRSSESSAGALGWTMSRWIPPQHVHRMVQYSHAPRPARPGMMLITTSAALHCGQLDGRGGCAGGLCPVSSRGMAGPEIAGLEALDM